MSRRFAIQSKEEAAAYLAHPVLGKRLRECCEILLRLPSSSAFDVFGSLDERKLHSCMTLFAEISGPERLFAEVLEALFYGQRDVRTLESIALCEGCKNVD